MRRLTRGEYLSACLTAAAVAPGFLARPYLSVHNYRRYQERRIRRLLFHAYDRTEFYRRLYDRAGVSPADFRALEDLRHFPTTTKEQLVAAIEAGELGPRRDGIESVSSGSSGRVIRVTHHVPDIHAYAAGRFRILNINGRLRPWDRTVYIYTSEFPARSFFGLYPSSFIPTLNDLDDTIRRLQSLRPRVLCVYPSRLIEIAARLDRGAARALGIALISVNSETSSREQRATLADHFGCPVLDEYSTEELGWTAAECAHGQLHVWEDMARLEILRLDTDEAPEHGEAGEIVGTNLHNFATPFIRYRQGDLGELNDVACPCGRNFRVLRNLVGRCNDAFHFESESVSPAYLLDAVYSLLLEERFPIADFCLIQTAGDAVRFEYTPRGVSAPELDVAIADSLATLLPSGIHVEAVPRTALFKTATGKRNPIVSLVRGSSREPAHV